MTVSDANDHPHRRPGALSTTIVRDTATLERWRADWDALLARSASNQVTQSPFWLLAWWRIFGPLEGRRLVAGLFFDGDRLVGVAPLLTRVHRYHRVLPFRRLELVATGEPEADEIVSEYLGLVIERGYEEAVADAFAGALDSGRFGEWDELLLSLMDGEAPASPLLQPALARRGLGVASAQSGTAPLIKLPRDWNAYLAALSGSGRYMVKRSIKDFEKWAGADARVERATTAAQLEEGKQILVRLHETRWKAAGLNGVFASQAFRAFHDGIMRELLEREALELTWLKVGGQAVAVSYSIVWNNRVQFYQGGRMTEVPHGIRPGIVLHVHAIKAAIAAGREEYDFLSGASQYKLQMSTATRPLVSLRASRPRARESLRRLADRGVDLLRQGRRQLRELIATAKQRASGEPPQPPGDSKADTAKQDQDKDKDKPGAKPGAKPDPKDNAKPDPKNQAKSERNPPEARAKPA